MDDPERRARLALAQAIRESADHSSEQALRNALSRSYYSVFHVGCSILGKGFGDHKQFLRELKQFLKELRGSVGDELGSKVEKLQDLRIQADYRFDAVGRVYESLEEFRRQAADGLRLGQEVYRELWHMLEEVAGA